MNVGKEKNKAGGGTINYSSENENVCKNGTRLWMSCENWDILDP